MSDTIVCLGCGGVVEPDSAADPAKPRCRCPSSFAEASTIVCSGCGGPLRWGARACTFCGSTVATCRCSVCLGWNIVGADYCQACGRSLTGEERTSQRNERLACPRCSHALSTRNYADLVVEECDQCGGVFLTPGMLDRLVQARERCTGLRLALPKRSAVAEQTVTYVRCPSCCGLMNRQAFGRISGVVVDVCRSHGVWFDPGELTQVIRFIETGGLERARAREAAESRQRHELRSEPTRPATPSFGVDAVSGGEVSYRELGRELWDILVQLWRGARD
jgi:Zn-finger nucleic acid-binding protein